MSKLSGIESALKMYIQNPIKLNKNQIFKGEMYIFIKLKKKLY